MRALRVGVLLGENLVEERVFADAHPITIGQSLRCRLSVPVDGMPYEHTLFVRDQGRLLLKPVPKMTGRVAQNGEMTELTGEVAIERGARGKLKIGEATILFQEVAMPAKAPRPQLPPSVKGTLADRIDRRLAVIVGGSILLHLGIAGWAWATDREDMSTQTAQAYRHFQQDTYEISVPDEVDVPGTATPVTPTQPTTPITPTTNHTPAPVTHHAPSNPAPAMTEAEAQRFAQMLTSDNEGTNGHAGMSGREPGADLNQQIHDIRDNGRTIGDTTKGFRDREREGIGDGRDHIVDGNPNQLATQNPRDEKPPGRVTLVIPHPPPPPPGKRTTPTPEQIVAKIKTDYMAGLMRCYQKGLLDDATLSGKVAVTFTIAENGKLSDSSAHGVSLGVDACISTQMASWHFPQPKDADGDPTDLDFQMSLALVPNQ